jgi:hypothetical protein
MSSIKGNVKSFVFDNNRTITFWAKDNEGGTVNEIAYIVGSVNANLEVTSFSQEYTAMTSASESSFLLKDGKLFAFEKISANSFIIATYVITNGLGRIIYRIGTLNGLSITFGGQVEINRNAWGETIKLLIIDNKAILFYGTNDDVLYSVDTSTGIETEWIYNDNKIEFAQWKIDASLLNNKLVLVGYRGDNQYWPPIIIANYVNDSFVIESVTPMEDVRVSGVAYTIEGELRTQLSTGVFFSDANKFFLAFADNQNNAVPA